MNPRPNLLLIVSDEYTPAVAGFAGDGIIQTPNQYLLPDGRMFDAEKSLCDVRWLAIPPGCSGGIIPQQFG